MNSQASIRKWVGHKLDAEIERRFQRLAGAQDVTEIAVMPDVHLAGDVCNGVVVATKQMIYPQCVGGDIGCGYLSVALTAGGLSESDSVEVDEAMAAQIIAGLYRAVPLNKHSDRDHFQTDSELSAASLAKANLREGRLQLGTLGRGNHFVELQHDQENRLWLLVHSGSRAMGQLISSHHLKHASVDSSSGLKFIDAQSEAGRALLNDFEWARQYAAANRLEMLDSIEQNILPTVSMTADRETIVHLDHNHLNQETYDGQELWIHRKGAQHLPLDQTSVVPGSMGTKTYVVAGRGNRSALNSCSHGAGRTMSRSEAATQTSARRLRREMRNVWFDQRKIVALLDETPSAYKDIRKVMKAQKDLVRIIDQRNPVLNFKGR